MKFLKKKTIAISFFGATLAVLVYFYLMIRHGDKFSLDVVLGIIKPFGVLAFAGIFFSTFFLFFPEAIYRSWLKHIAWWYIPGLIIITLTTQIYSSNIFALSRSETVLNGMILLVIITIPYVFWLRRKIK